MKCLAFEYTISDTDVVLCIQTFTQLTLFSAEYWVWAMDFHQHFFLIQDLVTVYHLLYLKTH